MEANLVKYIHENKRLNRKEIAVFDKRNISAQQVKHLLEERIFSPLFVTMSEEQFLNIFDSNDIPDCPMDWEPENQDDLPHVGDVVWAFVKDGGSFQLYVKQMVVSKKDDTFLYLSAGSLGCRFTRPEWMKSVFPTEQEANDGLKKYLAESRYSVD